MLPQFFNIEHTATTHLLSFENTGRDDSNCWYSTSSLCSSSKLLMRPATACIAVGWTVAVCDNWARCEKQLNGKTRLESWLHTQFGTSDLGTIFGIPIACFGPEQIEKPQGKLFKCFAVGPSDSMPFLTTEKRCTQNVQPKVSATSAVVSLLFRKTATGIARFCAFSGSTCKLLRAVSRGRRRPDKRTSKLKG